MAKNKTEKLKETNVTEVKKDAPSIVYARAKYLRISPYKVRRVAKLIRGQYVKEAFYILKSLPHEGARVLEKVLKSAQSNSVHNFNFDENKLIVNELLVDEAPRMKRFQPRARGRMYRIIKRSSHVTLGVSEIGGKI